MIKKLSLLYFAILVASPAIGSAGVVYNTLGGTIDTVHGGFENSEFADQVLLGGTERTLTEIVIDIRGDFLEHGLDGDEFVSIQFYHNDGPAGAPGSLFYQSPLIPILSPTSTTGPQIFGDLIVLALPNVLAPDSFIWSLKRFGMTGTMDQIAMYAGGSPTVGASDDFIWINNGSGWIQSELGSSQANYHVMISALDDPVPAVHTSFGAIKAIYR